MNLAAAAQERLAEYVVNGSVTGSSDHDDDRRVFGALALHRSTEDGEDEVLPRLAVDESNEYISVSLCLCASRFSWLHFTDLNGLVLYTVVSVVYVL